MPMYDLLAVQEPYKKMITYESANSPPKSQTSKEIDIPKFKQLILDNQNTEPLEYQKLYPVAGKINSDLNAQPRKMAG